MKSSAEKASASHTCKWSLAGTFSSDSSQEKKLAYDWRQIVSDHISDQGGKERYQL